MANRISVVVGFSETIRDGAPARRIESPKSSVPYAMLRIAPSGRPPVHAATRRSTAAKPPCLIIALKHLRKIKGALLHVGEVPVYTRKLASATGSSPEEPSRGASGGRLLAPGLS